MVRKEEKKEKVGKRRRKKKGLLRGKVRGFQGLSRAFHRLKGGEIGYHGDETGTTF